MSWIFKKHIAILKHIAFAIVALAIVGKTIQKTVDAISNSKYELVDASSENNEDDSYEEIKLLIPQLQTQDTFKEPNRYHVFADIYFSAYVLKIPSPPPEIS